MREDLVIKHKNLLDMLTWEGVGSVDGVDLVQAIQCPLNPGIIALGKPLEAYIYVDDILASAVGKKNILRLLAAIIEAIFTVCDRSNIEIWQCPLSLEKWEELIIGTDQTILGLTIDTNKLTVGITWEYQNQVKDLLDLKWPASWKIFSAANIQKLVGKMARLGEGAPWIYKLISHMYTSLAFALKQNKALLLACSPKFQEIVDRIERKQFSGNHSKIAKELNFALKTTAKLVNSHKQVYLFNNTMQAELEFIRQAIANDSGIVFEVPIAFIIPRTSAASLFGDSSLQACGGYSTTLKFWWYTSFPDNIIRQTLLHISNNKSETFISINCLKYVTIIINYCAAITALLETQITNDPHPVVLSVTDNISAKNWTLHTSKNFITG